MNKKIIKNAIEFIKTILIAIIITFFVKYFIVDLTAVSGRSMEPTLQTGDIMVVNKISNNLGTDYKRGDIVIVNSPIEDKLYIKRVIGLPNDEVVIKEGSFYINDHKLNENYLKDNTITKKTTIINSWHLEPDEYFLVGDNREKSKDSRKFGPIKKSDFVGKAFLRIYPFYKINKY